MRKAIHQAQVQWGGWSLPAQSYDDRFGKIQNRADSIEGTFAIESDSEVWQLHKSGAFMFSRLLRYLADEAGGHVLPFEEVIYSVALGVLFAQRLYQQLAPNGQIEYEFALLATKGHRLGTYDKFMRRLHNEYRSGEDLIVSRGSATVLDLRSAWRPVVHRVVKDLFILFNWEIQLIAIDQRLDELEGKRRR